MRKNKHTDPKTRNHSIHIATQRPSNESKQTTRYNSSTHIPQTGPTRLLDKRDTRRRQLHVQELQSNILVRREGTTDNIGTNARINNIHATNHVPTRNRRKAITYLRIQKHQPRQTQNRRHLSTQTNTARKR